MLKKWLKRHFSSKKILKEDAHLSCIKKWTQGNDLWHLNRRAVAKGVAIGLLVAFIPLPLQMLTAAVLSILIRANIPIAIALTWITNPITFVPINYFIYRVGKWILNEPIGSFAMTDFDWSGTPWPEMGSKFLHWLGNMSTAFLIGLPIVAVSISILGYFLTHIIWRISTNYRWRQRKKERKY